MALKPSHVVDANEWGGRRGIAALPTCVRDESATNW